jgi:hypothetical protein
MYEMEVSAIYLMGGCNDKLDRYNDRTCEVLTLNETIEPLQHQLVFISDLPRHKHGS